MVLTPFLVFYAVGIILQSSHNYLVKLGLFMTSFVVPYAVSQLMFDDRLKNLLPMSIYLATKVLYYLQFLHTSCLLCILI